ncbi:hypothetical protein SBD_1870 [Streptomyces bottropensis ATCC 25435]|uniref:Uncharacterized protein n=1 Tax=Streptomyces bottropensis ATCC 25435 TaxID=1054862 RepID=M3DIZ6_9ACTN|nr:hypothetical protein SBD_1870 [Streptomyces bottropensis ATCC 25435]
MIYLGAYSPMKRRTRMFALRTESFPASENAVGIELLDQAKTMYPPSPKLSRHRLHEHRHRARRQPRNRCRSRQ